MTDQAHEEAAPRRPRRHIVLAMAIVLVAAVVAGAWYVMQARAARQFAQAVENYDLPAIRGLAQSYPTIILLPAQRNAALCDLSGKSPDAFRFLAEHGASVNAVNADGVSPIHLAAALGNTANVEYLLSRGVSPNARDRQGRTPLHHLMLAGGTLPNAASLRMLALLRRHGADAGITDATGRAPIEMSENVVLIKALLDSSAQADLLGRKAAAPDSIPLAANAGNLELVKLYLLYGGDIDARDTSMRTATALHYAVQQGHQPVVRFLLDKGANPNVKDWHEKTPLFYALQEKDDAMIALLKKHGGKE